MYSTQRSAQSQLVAMRPGLSALTQVRGVEG